MNLINKNPNGQTKGSAETRGRVFPRGIPKPRNTTPCGIRPPAKPGGKIGKTLMNRVRELLAERSLNADGRYNTRFDDVANAFIRSMETGSFVHLKEFIDREEGKVPNRVADAEGKNLKLYVGVPVGEGDTDTP